MKKLISVSILIVSAVFLAGCEEAMQSRQEKETIILPKPVFDVRDYGAVGDGTIDDTAAIQAAVDDCIGTGGTVSLSHGTYLSGMITLGSDMTFHVCETAVLLGKPWTPGYKEYYPDLPRDFESRSHEGLQRALVYANKARNLRLTGRGTIDGNAYTWEQAFWEHDYHESQRPLILVFHQCTDLLVEHLRLKDSVMWTSVYDQCEYVTIQNLEIFCDVLENNDGIDLIDSSHVKVLNNKIWADDDNICLKSNTTVGLEDILIQGNVLYSGRANAIKLGTDSTGPVKNVRVYDNLVLYARITGLSWESVDGSQIEGLHVKNLEIHDSGSPLFLIVGERGRGGHEPGYIRDVLIENVYAFDTHYTLGMTIMGLPREGSKISDVTLRNSYFEMDGSHKWQVEEPDGPGERYPEATMFGVLPAYGFYVRDAEDITFENVTFGHIHNDIRPWLVTQRTENVRTIHCREIGRTPPKEFDSPLWKTPFRMKSSTPEKMSEKFGL